MSECKVFFNDVIVESFQYELARGIALQYREARKWCFDEFSTPEAVDLLPIYRRACIETMFLALSKKYPGFDVSIKKNAKKNCSHRCLTYENILMTESLVRDKKAPLPRKAVFRGNYAESQQGLLFEGIYEDDEKEYAGDPNSIYGIIIHSPENNKQLRPAFVDIVFPARDCKSIHDRIELFDKFPDAVDMDRENDMIPHELQLNLRKDIISKVRKA